MSRGRKKKTSRKPLPVVRLHAVPKGLNPADVTTADARMAIGGQPVRLDITVPAGPTTLEKLLPVFQGLTNLVVDIAVRNVERQGLTISCRKGCGACCRQPVPITESEARALAQLVERMPEPRQSQIRARFADALRQLEEAGLLHRIRQPSQITDPEVMPLGLAYFRLGIACPFLEDESCSIHLDRPLACREFLVTSPAENCQNPSEETVRRVPLPGEVFRAVRAADGREANSAGWTTLILALEWAEQHPEGPSQPGQAWLQDVFAQLSKRGEDSGR